MGEERIAKYAGFYKTFSEELCKPAQQKKKCVHAQEANTEVKGKNSPSPSLSLFESW